MGLVTPGLGLIVWMTLAFLIVLFALTKFAWKPILNSLREREQSIEDALKAADKAREEMAQLTSDHEKIRREANEERNLILKEAKEVSGAPRNRRAACSRPIFPRTGDWPNIFTPTAVRRRPERSARCA